MNHLNSILIEGDIESADFSGQFARLVIESRRAFKNAQGEYETEKNGFVVRIENKTLIEAAKKEARAGRGIRIVGRIYNDWHQEMRVLIIPEHMEYKPVFATATITAKTEGGIAA